MRKKYLSLFVLLVGCKLCVAQPHDSTRFITCFTKGKLTLSARSVFMSTTNSGDLKDDYGLGLAAGLSFETRSFHGFQFGISDYAILKIASSKLDEPDSTTKNMNRYEVGLFDVNDTKNRFDMNKLEKLYLKYTYSKSSIALGRIGLNTPFINPQDGRLRPTAQEGIWVAVNEWKRIQLAGGWITGISPRSTARWYKMGESFGIYPSGVNTQGVKSNYKNHIDSKGMGLLNIQLKPTDKLKINLWNGYIENVLNTAMLEVNHELKIRKGKHTFYQGLMLLRQDAVDDGGNQNQTMTYVRRGASSNIFSLQLGVKGKKLNTNINYTRITSHGQYLMPREWGRDPFYTFMPRERNEGLGDVHAWMAKSTYTKKQFKTSIALGYYKLPDVKKVALNKYGFPSYMQVNYEAAYSFSKALKNLGLRMLLVYKKNEGETYDNLKYVYNKVDMFQVNVMIDYSL